MTLFGKGGYFDRLEDRTRRRLVQRSPKLYALVSGVAAVLSWAAIWAAADAVFGDGGEHPVLKIAILACLGIPALLLTGAFVNLFGDKEIIEETKKELDEERALLKKEEKMLENIATDMRAEKQEIKEINEKLGRVNNS